MNDCAYGFSRWQAGKSAIGSLIVLAVLGFGFWVGIQYIPQRIEAASIGSILESVQQSHRTTPIRQDADVWKAIDRYLSINEMRDMRGAFKTNWSGQAVTVTAAWERDLNLVFTTRTIEYMESIVLQ